MTNLDALLRSAASLEKNKRRPLRAVTYDIETSGEVSINFGRRDVNISPEGVIMPQRVICFAFQEVGKSKVHFVSEWENGHDSMIRAAWQMLNDYDVVYTYNGKNFDNKWLQSEFAKLDLPQPAPWTDVDLYHVSRSNFALPSYRLNEVCRHFGLGSKVENGGITLWKTFHFGTDAEKAKAKAMFRKYNIHDVVLTSRLALRLNKYVKLPHRGVLEGNPLGCYSCGSDNLVAAGTVRSRTNSWEQVLCGDCGTWNKKLKSGATRPVK